MMIDIDIICNNIIQKCCLLPLSPNAVEKGESNKTKGCQQKYKLIINFFFHKITYFSSDIVLLVELVSFFNQSRNSLSGFC